MNVRNRVAGITNATAFPAAVISSAAASEPVSDPIDKLVAAATRGDEPAVTELLERSLPRLHAFVRLRMGAQIRAREDSFDLVQSVCRIVLEDLDGFEYRGERQFDAWLFTAALNKLRERGRFVGRERRDPKRERPLDVESSRVYASMMTPSQVAIGAEAVDRLEAAFDRLPDDYREVITLSRVVRLSHAEIAAQMGRSPNATRTLLGRALARLGDELEHGKQNGDLPDQ